jgi:hypothetical protein
MGGIMTEPKHYDGDVPEEPLPAEHFREADQKEARDLGDGSPGIEPRSVPEKAKKHERETE